jgi:flagellar biogenesis protein FliO
MVAAASMFSLLSVLVVCAMVVWVVRRFRNASGS